MLRRKGFQINNFILQKTRKITKPKVSQKREITKIIAEINTRETISKG